MSLKQNTVGGPESPQSTVHAEAERVSGQAGDTTVHRDEHQHGKRAEFVQLLSSSESQGIQPKRIVQNAVTNVSADMEQDVQ